VLTQGGVRVLIVSESQLHREGLALRLSVEPGIVAVGSSDTIDGALATARDGHANIVLIDTAPTRENRQDLVSAVRATPDVRFVTLASARSDDEVVAWADAGASGIVDRMGSPEELTVVLEAVSRGELVCSPRIAGALLRHVRALGRVHGPVAPHARLTKRECDVLSLISRGMTNKEIARHLRLRLPTVKNHVHNIFEKLEVRSRVEAVSRGAGQTHLGVAPDEEVLVPLAQRLTGSG
jgi:two-component system nitrate/nitrite response regulator NarL